MFTITQQSLSLDITRWLHVSAIILSSLTRGLVTQFEKMKSIPEVNFKAF